MKSQLIVMKQQEDYQSPFELGAPGFCDRWWDCGCYEVSANDTDYAKLIIDGTEVARAVVDKSRLPDSYENLSGETDTIEIRFFEVKDDHRRQGIGKEFAERLTEHYAPNELIAFSEDADEFWASIGWIRCPRKDKDGCYRPLFVTNTW